MENIEYRREDFLISTDKSRLQIERIHDFLTNRSYWAKGRSLETVKLSIEHSLCFGVYAGDVQVGFARVVTDYCTFAWLSDVFIEESHRGFGLGKWLLECILAHPGLQNLRRFLLATRDAHELYHKYGGFQPLQHPERCMERIQPNASR
jgi:GNAT superfamily N-acetyltransferase